MQEEGLQQEYVADAWWYVVLLPLLSALHSRPTHQVLLRSQPLFALLPPIVSARVVVSLWLGALLEQNKLLWPMPTL